ncbi:PGF-CTERM sorting domain-containing protein [Halococcus sp. PRR34]|uniref:PGF-CTERM sorting domain-containing protein n=1 Tax=Halococcus sp. PRR34 TaxID=3020830 RepID=UPI002362A246|nr:PGF-CTERM sorting domain-containing protein [Halococcus sp. PRR34]
MAALVSVVLLLGAGLTFAPITVAQDGGDASTTGEPNDNRENAVSLNFESRPVEGLTEAYVDGFDNQSSLARFGPGDEEDWYSFEVEAGQAIRAWGYGGVAQDVEGTLVGPDGNVVADLTMGGDNSPNGAVAEESGTYYIRMVNNTITSPPIEYGLTVQVIEQSQLEPNDNRNSATPLTPEEPVTSTLAPGTDTDWYAVEASEGATINATLNTLFSRAGTPYVGNRISVDVFDADGERVSEAVDLSDVYVDATNETAPAGGTDVQKIAVVAESVGEGVYYVRVSGGEDASSIGFSTYSLSISGDEIEEQSGDDGNGAGSQLPNTFTVRSTGEGRVSYTATASESITPGSGADLTGATQPDEVSGSTASGSTAQGGIDNYTFSGELTDLNLEGGPAEVYVNGERIDPAEYQATPTLTTTPTATLTPTSTPTATPTPTATSTPTPTTTNPATSTVRSTTISTVRPTSTVNQPSMPVTDAQTQTLTEGSGQIVNGTDTDTGTSGSSGPGFGVVVAVVALVVTGTLAARRY